MFTTQLQTLSTEPLVMAEFITNSLTMIQFRPTECNVTAEMLEVLTQFHELSSGGAIKVQLDMLEIGIVLIVQNCAIDNRSRFMTAAVQSVVRRLRETCASCEDFNASLYEESEADSDEPC